MTTVRAYFAGERLGPKFERQTMRQRDLVLRSVRQASQEVADLILTKGRQDIDAASPAFAASPRWKAGLHVPVTEGGGNIRISVEHDLLRVGFRVHQFGATIRGKPLLWIPLPGVSPGERGDFFARSRRGNLLLFQKTGKKTIRPLRVAKTSVFVPKRFHVLEIARETVQRIRDFYNKQLAANKNA